MYNSAPCGLECNMNCGVNFILNSNLRNTSFDTVNNSLCAVKKIKYKDLEV